MCALVNTTKNIQAGKNVKTKLQLGRYNSNNIPNSITKDREKKIYEVTYEKAVVKNKLQVNIAKKIIKQMRNWIKRYQ